MPKKISKSENASTTHPGRNIQAGMTGGINTSLQAWGPLGEYMTDAM